LLEKRGVSFPKWTCCLILRSTSAINVNEIEPPGMVGGVTKRGAATIYLNNYLTEKYATFSLDPRVYFQIVLSETGVPIGISHLRLFEENNCLVVMTLSFVNVPLSSQVRIIKTLQSDISAIEHSSRTSDVGFKPVVFSLQPIKRLLISYTPPVASQYTMKTIEISKVENIHKQQDKFTHPGTIDGQNVGGFESDVASAKRLLTYSRNLTPYRRCMEMTSFYLKHHRWIWLFDVTSTFSNLDGDKLPIHDLGYQLIYRSRIQDGFLLISEYPNSLTLYQAFCIKSSKVFGESDHFTSSGDSTMETNDSKLESQTYTIQFILIKDPRKGTVVTEVWMESFSEDLPKDVFSRLLKKMTHQDAFTFSRIYTFDYIYGSIISSFDDSKGSRIIDQRIPRPIFHGKHITSVPIKCDLSVLLQGSEYICSLFKFPNIHVIESNNGPIDLKTVLPPSGSIGQSLEPIKERSSESRVQSPPSDSKHQRENQDSSVESYAGSCPSQNVGSTATFEFGAQSSSSLPNNRNYMYLHSFSDLKEPGFEQFFLSADGKTRSKLLMCLFFNKSLFYLMDGEVPITSQIRISSDPMHIISEILLTESNFSKQILVRNLNDCKCFFKILDASTLLLVLVPSVHWLVMEESESITGITSNDHQLMDVQFIQFLSCCLFICKRPQSDLSPATKLNSPISEMRNQSNGIAHSYFFNEYKQNGDVILNGVIGNDTNPVSKTSIKINKNESPYESDETLSQEWALIKEIYTYPFVQTIYAELLQGNQPYPEDLRQAFSLCREDVIEIDLTEFLNVRALISKRKNLR